MGKALWRQRQGWQGCSCKPWTPRNASHCQKLARDEEGFFPSALRESAVLPHLDFRLLPPELRENTFRFFKPLSSSLGSQGRLKHLVKMAFSLSDQAVLLTRWSWCLRFSLSGYTLFKYHSLKGRAHSVNMSQEVAGFPCSDVGSAELPFTNPSEPCKSDALQPSLWSSQHSRTGPQFGFCCCTS